MTFRCQQHYLTRDCQAYCVRTAYAVPTRPYADLDVELFLFARLRATLICQRTKRQCNALPPRVKIET